MCCCLPTGVKAMATKTVLLEQNVRQRTKQLPSMKAVVEGPPASFSIHLASSAVTQAWSVHKSRGDNVVHMWVQLKR